MLQNARTQNPQCSGTSHAPTLATSDLDAAERSDSKPTVQWDITCANVGDFRSGCCRTLGLKTHSAVGHHMRQRWRLPIWMLQNARTQNPQCSGTSHAPTLATP